MQAKDLTVRLTLYQVAAAATARGHESASRWDIAERLPGAPEKVVRAKLRSLVRQEFLTGCSCGCRGDFALTQKGRDEVMQWLATDPAARLAALLSGVLG